MQDILDRINKTGGIKSFDGICMKCGKKYWCDECADRDSWASDDICGYILCDQCNNRCSHCKGDRCDKHVSKCSKDGCNLFVCDLCRTNHPCKKCKKFYCNMHERICWGVCAKGICSVCDGEYCKKHNHDKPKPTHN